MKTGILLGLFIGIMICGLRWPDRAVNMSAQAEPQSFDFKQSEIDYVNALLKITEAAKLRDDVSGRGQHEVHERNITFLQTALKSPNAGNTETLEELVAKHVLDEYQNELDTANKLNLKVPSEQTKAYVERLQDQVEMAKAGLKMAQPLKYASPEQRLEWLLMRLESFMYRSNDVFHFQLL